MIYTAITKILQIAPENAENLISKDINFKFLGQISQGNLPLGLLRYFHVWK